MKYMIPAKQQHSSIVIVSMFLAQMQHHRAASMAVAKTTSEKSRVSLKKHITTVF